VNQGEARLSSTVFHDPVVIQSVAYSIKNRTDLSQVRG
jgi:hypothetical protein